MLEYDEDYKGGRGKMKKQRGLYFLLLAALVLSGCTQKNESEPLVETTQPLEVEKGVSKGEKYKITTEDLEQQRELEATRARVKEQIRLQKEERKKQEYSHSSDKPKKQESAKKETKESTKKEPTTKKPTENLPTKEPTKREPIKIIEKEDPKHTKDEDHTEAGKEGQSANEAKELALKKDFTNYRMVFEIYLRENMTKDFAIDGLNAILGRKNQVSGTNLLALETEQENPWGKPYQIELNKAEQKVVVRAYDDKQKGYVLATYYHEGVIANCMSGFEKDDIALTLPLQKGHVCGGNLDK